MKALNASYMNESLSHATMREIDLIPDFMSFMETVSSECGIESEVKAIRDEVDKLEYLDEDTYGLEYTDESREIASHILWENIWTLLNDIAPMGTTFGSHPGDGSDYGFWSLEPDEVDYNLWIKETGENCTIYVQIMDAVKPDSYLDDYTYHCRLWIQGKDTSKITPTGVIQAMTYDEVFSELQTYGDLVECPIDNQTLESAYAVSLT